MSDHCSEELAEDPRAMGGSMRKLVTSLRVGKRACAALHRQSRPRWVFEGRGGGCALGGGVVWLTWVGASGDPKNWTSSAEQLSRAEWHDASSSGEDSESARAEGGQGTPLGRQEIRPGWPPRWLRAMHGTRGCGLVLRPEALRPGGESGLEVAKGGMEESWAGLSG